MLSAGPADHAVVFYQSEEELADRLTDYLLGAITRDGVAIVLAAPARRQTLSTRLASAGVDIAQAKALGSYVERDAADTMASFMVNGWADPASFWRAITPLLKTAAPDRRPVRIVGEMVALLWQHELISAALDVEALWNELRAQYAFELLCAYPDSVCREHEHADAIAQVCAEHGGMEAAELR